MVICDTNIWYRLGDGRIKPSEFGENQLVVTGVTVEELCTSEMIFSDSESFKSAIRAINKYATQFIEYDPIEYILSQISSDFKPNRLPYIEMMASLQSYLKTEPDNNEKKNDELKKSIIKWNTPHLNLVNILNKNLVKVRGHTKQFFTKKEFRQLDTVPEIVSMFNEIFKSRTKNSGGTIKFKDIDWENFELLLFIWDDYFESPQNLVGFENN